ncbi:glycoside hydrolase family 31 protein [Karstenula rhodostoma CBS 690.94]|uniref:Glycoside hydrolase family 31 protein n=1 Tax=Karstenula rhodostoma CBS 690.94 TaxID=1392251 RepID=A0A9P4U8P1_9PLEO|nr:glycoside hydrolase family 31 protein [Karstenula rhodostoma CBS 690.94]
MARVTFLALSALLTPALCDYRITLTPSSGLLVTDGNATLVNNTAVLVGGHNTTAEPLKNDTQGLTYSFLTPTVAQITLNTSNAFHGARFSTSESTRFYGVWEYPFNNRIDNANMSFDLKGVGNNVGVNWSNARAPFFLTSAGYGVYADTLKMGSYDFRTPGDAQFIFNSSSLVYYIILPNDGGGLKSVIEQYTELSARSEIPPTSGLGPTFWSDDFTQDFHGNVSNAQENIQDVVNHLYDNRIRATSIFADRPYGSGNRSWGNFDFDPNQYPDPASFIKNLTEVSGIDFQVWIANRAQYGTKLYNASTHNHWLFPDDHPVGGLGEALNLSIPTAYNYFDESLKYFSAVGVKGYKIDRGEEGEMPDYVQNEQMALFLDLAYDSMVGTWGKGRFYNFARSAVDRSRAKTHVWNGDSHANFTGLAYSVASGIRSGLISFGIWGSDTGGYTREGALTPSPEVWARWMWFSAFSPVYELMLGTNHTPWYPPYDNTSTLAVMKQTANLHADLLPYIQSYTNDVSKTGLPIIRALFLEAEKDEKTWDVNDSYFFGSEFLVAPIVRAGGSRSVYFPVGPSNSYLEYFNKTQVYTAGTIANITSPLTSMPVFVKQGAIIPRGDVYQGNAKWIQGWAPDLRLELYPSFDVPESRFTYYGGGAETEIVLRTNKADRSATVDTGGLEFNGWGVKIVWFLKGAEKGRIMDMKVHGDGGSLKVSNIETLF